MISINQLSKMINRIIFLGMVLAMIAMTSLQGGQVLFPGSNRIFIQTNGPESEFNDGDWWTHKDYGNGPHIFLIEVPEGTNPNFIVEVMLFDPESYNPDPASLVDNDERKLGPWENTTFTLYSPTNALIHTQTYPGGDPTTNQQWVDFCNFRIGDWGTGMYELRVRVDGDDENGYKFGLKNGDTDNNPANGNEIRLWAKHAAFQMVGVGYLCHTFWFRVPPRMETLHLYNFDLDYQGDENIVYISPSGQTIPGTASLDAVWNTQPPQASLPTGDADQVNNPEPGWWQARICVVHETPLIDMGNQFIFLPDDLPFRDTPDDHRAQIGDLVWVDVNMNGLQDEDEPGLNGVTVRLLNGSDNSVLRTTTTDQYGKYLFDELEPGLYRVEFVLPNHFFFTAPLIGSNRAIDSDAIPPEGRTNLISLGPDEIRLDIDAGLIPKNVSDLRIVKTIEGSNRVRPGDEVVYLLTVTNLGPDEATHVRITDNIPAGMTFISAQRSQDEGPNPLIWYESSIAAGQTLTYRIRLRAGQSLGTFNNCGFISSPNKDDDLSNNISCASLYVEEGGHQGSNIIIGDRVWIDTNKNGLQDPGESGRANVQVNLLSAATLTLVSQTQTDLNGIYSFNDVPAGQYRLEFILPTGYRFTTPNAGNDAIDSDPDPSSGLTAAFEVVNDQQYRDWDAGLVENEKADLEVTKTIGDERTYFYIHEEIEFIIKVQNNGPDDAHDVAIIDNLPAGLQFISATRTQDEGPNPLIWREALIPVGGSVSYRVRMRATDVLGGMDNCVTVSSATYDPNIQNNIACVQLHVLVPVELSSFTAVYQPHGVELRWVTQSETENMGFHILRSEAEDGTYLQITKTLIPGAGTSSSVHHYSYMDTDLPATNVTYYYKLADVDYKGRVNLHGPVSVKVQSPDAYLLEQNYPNPFNPETKINFSLKEAGHVQLRVFNVKGELIRTLISQPMEAGSHLAVWDGKDDAGNVMTSGLYIYSLRVNNYEEKRTMLLLK